MIFGPAFYWTKRRYDLKEKSLTSGGQEERAQLEVLANERKLLVERIENLESVVCSTDYELNLRIAQLAAAQSAAPALSGEAATAPPATATENAPATDAGAGSDATIHGSDSSLRDKAAAVRTAHGAPAELPLGHVLGSRYRIDRLLGRGGMGAVYLASDQVLGEQVALKVIASSWSHDRNAMVDRFRREASAARKVSSPHVIRIHDLGETDDGLLYLSMEYFAGQTLGELLSSRGPLGKMDIREILGQICDGLGAAHQAGVIHRDLKPQNVLVNDQKQVKLIDFGLAKTAFMAGVTATGLMLGTPYYMSPEQVRSKDVDVRSDIYSLGALAYHAVTGRPPLDGDNPIAVGFAHLSEEPVPPRQHAPGISKELDAMILAALAKDPRDRPSSAAMFRQAL